jgi:hypothetical protein
MTLVRRLLALLALVEFSVTLLDLSL